ncbi:hypothetical protein GCM10023340_02930 [Nocardioides marinquilinus]|uniref:SHOCT domain-containing protein n=1 Tax=Nocardioides marinquilinus TaxID=1210400 RepID=A0ABP9P5Y5_9ACTN
MGRGTGRAVERPPSLPRTFAKMLAMMLVFGIVGPLFLGLYVILDLPDTGWMLGWGIAITVLDVVLAAVVAVATTRAARRRHRLGQFGLRVRAELVSVDRTGISINDDPVVWLRLRAHLPDESERRLHRRVVVPQTRLALIDGRDVVVHLDPTTDDFDVDWQATAGLARRAADGSGAAPARPRAERLAELDDLMHRDLLTREEYDAARARILAEI